VKAVALGEPLSDAEWRLDIGFGQDSSTVPVMKSQIEPGVASDYRKRSLVAATRCGQSTLWFLGQAWIRTTWSTSRRIHVTTSSSPVPRQRMIITTFTDISGTACSTTTLAGGLDSAASDEMIRLDLGQVSEVRSERDLEVEGNRREPVVDDIEILVNAIADGAGSCKEIVLGAITRSSVVTASFVRKITLAY
jgi:hypothetical protein